MTPYEAAMKRLELENEMTEQPEALRLADAIDLGKPRTAIDCINAAAELRRLHEVNQELLEALNDCAMVMAHDLHGLSLIQPELKKALAAIARAAIAKAEGETK